MCLMGLLAGCETTDVTSVNVEDFTELSPSANVKTVAGLDVGDAIDISVEVDGKMEYSMHQAEVSRLGYVTLPLVGDVFVKGLSLEVARAEVRKRYSKYYVSTPVVMLSLIAEAGVAEWGQVSVLGRVQNPGPVELDNASGMRLSAAIQAAGGFSSSAKVSQIQITRTDSMGKRIQVEIDFNSIGKAGDADADLILYAGDIVNVPERHW